MEVHILNQKNSVLNTYLKEIRSVDIQKDPLRFRTNIERIGELMAYEISHVLDYAPEAVTTPLGTAEVQMIQDKVVLSTIFRAGLPLHQGFLKMFDRAENAFLSAYRYIDEQGNLGVHTEYCATPSLEGKTLMLVDPMLATGGSFEIAYDCFVQKGGQPKHVHLAAVIGSKAGVEKLKQFFADKPVTLWVAAVDEELNEKSYIVPGLGDAGDLCYGEKL